MKKLGALLAALAFIALTMNVPAKADHDDWYRDREFHNYREFQKAHYRWWKEHQRERKLSEDELRELYRTRYHH